MPFRDAREFEGLDIDWSGLGVGGYVPGGGGVQPGGGGGAATPPAAPSNPVTGGTTPSDTAIRDELGIPAWAWAIQPTYLWSFDPGTKLWTNPHTRQQYSETGQLVGTDPIDPKQPGNELGPTEPGGLGGNSGGGDPGDGPVPGAPGGQPQVPANISPNWDPPTGNFIGLPPPTGSSTGGGGGMANPMPGMPTAGVRPVPPHLAVSQQQGTPVGQREAFKPWGQPLGYLSQALRYGGTPDMYQTGGYGGMDAATAAALTAALRGEG